MMSRTTFQGDATTSTKALGCEQVWWVQEAHGGQNGWSTGSKERPLGVAGAGPQHSEGQDELRSYCRLKSRRVT